MNLSMQDAIEQWQAREQELLEKIDGLKLNKDSSPLHIKAD